MNSKDDLVIDFKKSAFATKYEVKEVEKPELKRFNMKFSQLDLQLIDDIAKRDGISRSQIINLLIERMVKDFVLSLASDIDEETALIVTTLTEKSYDPKTKSDKNFAWDVWYMSKKYDTARYQLDLAINDLNRSYYDNSLSFQSKKICEKLMKYKPQVHDADFKFPKPKSQSNS